jgi:CO dehydrogenase/acetyl-CoA synthase gamma subunit (corrinoid Fe-S protein)
MSTNVPPAVVANQAMAANNALGKMPNGVVPAPILNAAKKANTAVVNAAVNVLRNQDKMVKAAANATTMPSKANQATVNKAISIVNRTMKNLQNLKNKAVAANKNVVNAIISNNAANVPK